MTDLKAVQACVNNIPAVMPEIKAAVLITDGHRVAETGNEPVLRLAEAMLPDVETLMRNSDGEVVYLKLNQDNEQLVVHHLSPNAYLFSLFRGTAKLGMGGIFFQQEIEKLRKLLG